MEKIELKRQFKLYINKKKGEKMEKEMLVVAKLKEGTFEKFMGFMQS